jgi:hypothetical protein
MTVVIGSVHSSFGTLRQMLPNGSGYKRPLSAVTHWSGSLKRKQLGTFHAIQHEWRKRSPQNPTP